MHHRVVVTGMGLVTCLGTGKEANWDALANGRSGIGLISRFDATDFPARIAGEVKGDFDPEGYVPKKEYRRLDRHQQFTLVAASEAIHQSGLEFPLEDPYRGGTVLGSAMGGLESLEEGLYKVRTKGPKAAHPMIIPKAIINLAPGLLSIKYNLKGPNFAVANACSSGTSAIGEAYHLVKEGRADVVVTGGVEAVVTPLTVASFIALRALSTRNDEPTKASRPFDMDRDGFVIAEGSGILILESEEHARKRGARQCAEIAGYGATDDGYHIVMPDPEGEGAFQAMKHALESASVPPEKVDYINAHGTATDLNDVMETQAIKRLFGDAANRVAVSSTKSMTGHLLGAAGAVEAIFTIMAMQEKTVPPTINLDTPDPDCDLDYTPNTAVRKDMEYALSNSFAFGGQNASLVIKRA